MESQTGGEKPPFEQKIRLGPPRAPKEGKIPDHGASYRIWQTGTTGRGKAWVVTLGAALGAAYGFFRSEQQAEDAKVSVNAKLCAVYVAQFCQRSKLFLSMIVG